MLPLAPRLICCLNALLAFVSNTLLIFLIIRKSPKSIANYKYLMLSFAVSGLFFEVVDVTNQPFLHFYQGCYIVFSENPLGLPRWLSFWYLALNCSCYMMMLSILTFHFLYRYLVLCKPSLLYLFSWPHCNIFIGTSIIFTAGWTIYTVFSIGDSEESDEYIGATMLQTYGLRENDFTYVSTVFFSIDPITLMEHLSTSALVFNAIAGLFMVISFSVIVFCWLNVRHKLVNSAMYHQKLSKKTLEMQKQLFKCLIFQTLIPIVFMFIPASVIIIFPLWKLEPGHFGSSVFLLMTTQPFLDAIVPMYFVPDYRKAITRVFGGKMPKSSVVSVTRAS